MANAVQSGIEIRKKLIAQTPLIHFQPHEAGATLRATEVKPKLDKYLAKRYAAENDGADVPDGWKIPGQPAALQYKLRLQAADAGRIEDLGYKTPYDIFYGDTNTKKGVTRNVDLTILCGIPTLKAFIEEHLADFFIATNFGTMQNKGFGSFLVEDDPKHVTAARIAGVLKETYGAQACYSFEGGRPPFRTIKTVYTLMKAGINLNFKADQPFDEKKQWTSLLFTFLSQLPNEKGMLKENRMVRVFRRENEYRQAQGTSSAPKDHYYYVRALLGLCDHMEYERGKTTVRIEGEKRDRQNPKKKYFERMASPIFFKVIGPDVYYVAKPIPKNDREESIFGETFVFSVNGTEKSATVPTVEQLGGEDFLEKFLKHCMNEINTHRDEKQIGVPVIKEV